MKKKWDRKGNGTKMLLVLFSVVFVVSVVELGLYFGENYKREREFKELETMTGQALESLENGEKGLDSEDVDELKSTKYALLAEQNPDFAGWIKIDGTTVDYPVMQSKERPDFYLNHNFEMKTSSFGVPFLDVDCDLEKSDNLIIYGHHIKGGRMFAALLQYENEAFYEEHREIQFDTLAAEGTYQILSVFYSTAEGEDGFLYHEFVNAKDKQEFDEFVSECKDRSIYDTGVNAMYGDRLLTLSTCEYSKKDGRFVIVAKMIEN